jgi:hypothetical protein
VPGQDGLKYHCVESPFFDALKEAGLVFGASGLKSYCGEMLGGLGLSS